MDFGTPTEIKISVMKAIAELQNTASDIFVFEKKICDHVVYDKTDKELLVKQTLLDLTFLGVLARTGSSFALRQNLIVQVPSEASGIPWIDPRNQNENLKRSTEMKRYSAAKKKKNAAKIDSYFTKYFEIYKNMKANEIPENPEINTGPEDTTNMLPPNAVLEEQVLGNVNSKVKYTNHKKKQSFEDKKKKETEIDSLFASYFEKYKNIKTVNNPESSKARTPSKLGSTGLDDDNIILQLSAPLNDQTSKPMENVVKNAESMRKITMAKEIGHFKVMKKSYSCPELNFLFALKNIGDNPNVYVSKRGSILAPSGASAIPWIDPRNQNENLKRTTEMKRYSAAKKKKNSAKIDSYFTKYFEIYKNMKANEIPENPEINTGPEDTTNMLPPNALLEEQVLGNVKL